MQLQELADSLCPLRIEGSLEREVTGLAYDSRRVLPGMVFVAVPGRRTDGHEFVSDAVDRGACAVVCQRNGLALQKAARIKVADTREALARAAVVFYQNPSTRLRVIGVTGTSGKTIVAFLIKHLLETAGLRCGLIGTIRYEIGDRMIPAQRTTPEALEVQQMLAQMVRAGCQACVMEVSSHALDQKRTVGVEFDLGVFTNLTPDHLDYHGTMEDYFLAKRKLFCALERGGKTSGAVINLDDPFGTRLARETEAKIRLTYSLLQEATLHARAIQLSRDATRMTVHTPRGQFTCRLPLIGRHNAYNALAAVGAGLFLELPLPVIRKALATAAPVPGRLEPVSAGQPFGVFVDYAHTDDALRALLETVRELEPRRVITVFGCGGDRDKTKRPRMAAVVERLADVIFVTSDNPRTEKPEAIINDILVGFRNPTSEGLVVEPDRRRAIELAIEAAHPDDIVLLAGKGHETYQIIGDKKFDFSDKDIARQCLKERQCTRSR